MAALLTARERADRIVAREDDSTDSETTIASSNRACRQSGLCSGAICRRVAEVTSLDRIANRNARSRAD